MKMHRVLSAMLVGMILLTTGSAYAAKVKVTVNGEPITDVQIAQRVALLKLEGGGGTAKATDQLIDEALQLQEAQRLKITITEDQVDQAVRDVARNIKVSESNLKLIFTQNGISIDALRARLKANLAWRQVAGAVVSARVSVSEADVDAQARAKLTAANSFDYILKEVLFIGGNPSKRTAEANKFRASFKGCDSAVQISLNYTDAAVRDLGRRHATQFPDALASELSKLNVGGITKPRVVEGGVQMLAVCAKEQSEDTTFIAQNIRQNEGNTGLQAEAEKYLAELKAKAQIVKS